MLRKIAKVRRDSYNYVSAVIVKVIGNRIEFPIFIIIIIIIMSSVQ
jgi:hypothetical protein